MLAFILICFVTIRLHGVVSALVGEIATRFLVGGLVVSAFAVLGNLFRPKSFAGLFGAAPSVALATLALTITKNGSSYASIETRSMQAGAAALCCYSMAVAFLLRRGRVPALGATLSFLPLWFGVAYGLWWTLLK